MGIDVDLPDIADLLVGCPVITVQAGVITKDHPGIIRGADFNPVRVIFIKNFVKVGAPFRFRFVQTAKNREDLTGCVRVKLSYINPGTEPAGLTGVVELNPWIPEHSFDSCADGPGFSPVIGSFLVAQAIQKIAEIFQTPVCFAVIHQVFYPVAGQGIGQAVPVHQVDYCLGYFFQARKIFPDPAGVSSALVVKGCQGQKGSGVGIL